MDSPKPGLFTMSNLKETPMHSFNVDRGGRMVDFAGWSMPVQFKSILDEHRAVRSAAGLFDVSHMGEVAVRGPDAGRFLDSLVTNDLSKMTPGRVVYSPMCYPNGGVIDDLLVSMRGEGNYLVCVNASNTAKDLEWMEGRAADADCEVVDESAAWGLLALQGPTAVDVLRPLTEAPIDDLRYYNFVEADVAETPVIISRTGYTGEHGFEIFCPWNKTEAVALALEKSGKAFGLTMCGLGARDSLRLEAGYSLYGHEISEEISPLQARLGWTVKLAKEVPFVGREALVREKEAGASRKVVFFKTGDRRIVRPETPVLADDVEVGRVLSGTLSPVLNEAIGSALVSTRSLEGELYVNLRGNQVALKITTPPLVDLPKH